jgi:hypothetical protein
MLHFAIFNEKHKNEASQPHSHNYNQILIFDERSGTHALDSVAHPILDGSIHF